MSLPPAVVETVLTRLAALFLTGAAGDITAASLKRAEARVAAQANVAALGAAQTV